MSLKPRLADHDPLVGNWLSLSDPAVAELTAELGYDFAMIDMEHTPASLETVTSMVRGVDAADGETAPLVRLPWNDHVTIKRVLDVGVAGVMAPMIESGDDAASFVEATKHPPEGIRGMAGGRAAKYGLETEAYVERANDALVRIAQIETEAGIEHVEEIAATEGLDALFIGPADLSTNLGEYGDVDSEAFREAGLHVAEQDTIPDREIEIPPAEEFPIEDWETREAMVDRYRTWGTLLTVGVAP